MSKDQTQLKAFLQAESVLTIATGDACGPWSAPVLYVADLGAEPFALYFLSSANSRHIKSLPIDGAAAVSIYSDYDGDGIAELRRVVSIGESAHILENEEWDKVPFAVL
ncbi:MAG: portal protein, partial [Porticoccaceae bacterium]